jgi:hypothetical protein
MDETELHQVARKRVQMKRGLAVHLLLYVTVNAMLVVIWAVTGRGYPWFIWPLAGWGIGVVANAVAVAMELLAPEQQAIEREMRRMQRQRPT